MKIKKYSKKETWPDFFVLMIDKIKILKYSN